MRREYITILLIAFICCSTGWSQLYLPHTEFYHNEALRSNNNDTSNQNHNFYRQHQSMLPVLDSRTSPEIFQNEGKYYYWITQKLFKENFIVFEGKDYWCSIDPVVDLELGTDLSADSLERLYLNTRGIRIQGKFFDKVGFSTVVYENQAILPFYQREYADNHGEFFPNSLNTQYTQNNAVIPGYTRTKPFKENGYDFGFAQGYVSYVPNKTINFQLGNGNHFVGNGYRSLLLSDFTTNYPFAKIETNFWNDRIQYTLIYAMHQNLYRLTAFNTPEATFEKKIGTYHYLDIAVTEQLQVGLFEGSQWKRVDSLGSHTPDFLFLNPIIGTNTAIKGQTDEGYRSVFGINVNYQFKSNNVYGQLLIDRGQIKGYQLGFKALDLFIPKLDLQAEYNLVRPNTYLSENSRYNYSHFNLPMAHPVVNSFSEISLRLAYQYNRFFVQNRFTASQRGYSDSLQTGTMILEPMSPNAPTESKIFFYNQFEIGYRFNKSYNLQVYFGHLYRNEEQPTITPLTNYTYVGFRTALKNKYRDF